MTEVRLTLSFLAICRLLRPSFERTRGFGTDGYAHSAYPRNSSPAALSTALSVIAISSVIWVYAH